AAPGGGEGGGWLDLDARIETLAGSLLPAGGEVEASVLLRAFYTISEDTVGGATANESVSGVELADTDLAFDVARGSTAGRISFDLAAETDRLEDGYIRWETDRGYFVRLGSFKPRYLFSSTVDPELLLFPDRTFLGARFDDWDLGVELSRHYDQFDWWMAIMNGLSGTGADHLYMVRGEWAGYDAAWKPQEGARGAPQHLRTLLGATYVKESHTPGFGDMDAFGFDLALTYGPYALHTEIALLDDGAGGPVLGDGAPAVTLVGDSSPYAVTWSRMYGEEWQAALRYQKVDDGDRTRGYGFALHHYPETGPFGIVAEVLYVDSDAAPEGAIFRLGLNAGRTRR
ncbi:MAG: hypothetical protein AB1726_18805, partial [Planctomycetota bacterium]